MNRQRIKQLFLEVANEAREALTRGSTDEPKAGIVTTSLLIRSGLAFHAEVADLFFKNVDEAADLAKKNAAWSKSAVDRIFSEGLVAISDGVSVSDAANQLEWKLEKQPEKFQLRFGIFGLGDGCEETDFGGIRLVSSTVTPSHDFGSFLKKGVSRNYHYAEIEVDAVDLESAKLRGAALVDRHLAILNILCADGNTPTLSYLSRNYVGRHDFSIYQERADEEWSERISSWVIRRPVMLAEWQKILGGVHKERFSNLLRTQTAFAEHLLGALELAGSTFREHSPQNAFLLLAVALETALMGGKSEQEITIQFALRAALLSKGSPEQKVSLHKKIKRLYRLRSAIVHSGSRDITDRDLVEMRNVCLGCLIVLCTSNDFASISTFEDLEAWFLRRMLSAPDPSFETGP